MAEEFYTPTEVAVILRVKTPTIYGYIKKGELQAIKLGNRYRVSKTHFEDYVKKSTVGKKTAASA
jgi:putative molybdopterin biosynthesis protein